MQTIFELILLYYRKNFCKNRPNFWGLDQKGIEWQFLKVRIYQCSLFRLICQYPQLGSGTRGLTPVGDKKHPVPDGTGQGI